MAIAIAAEVTKVAEAQVIERPRLGGAALFVADLGRKKATNGPPKAAHQWNAERKRKRLAPEVPGVGLLLSFQPTISNLTTSAEANQNDICERAAQHRYPGAMN
jgi:hypothetical protein